MSEIVKCRCGAEARLTPPWNGRMRVSCVSDECDTRGPRRLSGVEAISAWNALMRQRPVARWGARVVVTYLYVGRAVLGYVITGQSGSESAVCVITGEHFQGYDAHEWLVARVLEAGIDVEDVSDE